uniref:Uncharacterized protein n=1 Tax=Nelumbo nucifera TaxID=4432 RepID=A0A822ZXC8_NELNU|nr:TPA_asm: hypothetical protein HUJ06_017952 [Nelumbo nucifera]
MQSVGTVSMLLKSHKSIKIQSNNQRRDGFMSKKTEQNQTGNGYGVLGLFLQHRGFHGQS